MEIIRMNDKDYPYKELTQEIIGAAYEVHNELGSGFVEKVYENALAFELRNKGFSIDQQKPVTVSYKGVTAGDFIADLVINNTILLEIKAVRSITKEFEAKLLHYLKSTGLPVGLIINFSESVQVKRKVFSSDFNKQKATRQNQQPSAPPSAPSSANSEQSI